MLKYIHITLFLLTLLLQFSEAKDKVLLFTKTERFRHASIGAGADAIKKHLVNKGIPKDQIITKAFGQEQPLAPNINPDGSDNPEGRSKNRRTEVKIVNL